MRVCAPGMLSVRADDGPALSMIIIGDDDDGVCVCVGVEVVVRWWPVSTIAATRSECTITLSRGERAQHRRRRDDRGRR